MKEINLNPKNIFSCQYCNKNIELEENTKIEVGLFPVCSNSCKFNIINGFFSRLYSDENLELLHKSMLKTNDKYEFNRNIAIFNLTKKFMKHKLSNVTILLSFITIKKDIIKNSDNLSIIKLSKPIYNIGLIDNDKSFISDKRLVDNGGLESWF
jgi:hypothetical protein|tara:strand:+ start:493 stop:954 length:462 start_codon:yes stop_codon:yes gene_type:complete